MPTGIYLHKKGRHWKMKDTSKISESLKKQWKEGKRISGMLGRHWSEESKERFSVIAKKKDFGKWMIGKKHSEETKQKISKANKGRKWSQESKRKLNELRKEGKNNPGWKGGITPKNKKIWRSIEMRLWRESIFARDNWTCQKCKEKGGKLQSHHIQNFAQYPELRFAIDNGITFCMNCHILFHKIFGRKNNIKKQIEKYLNKKK